MSPYSALSVPSRKERLRRYINQSLDDRIMTSLELIVQDISI